MENNILKYALNQIYYESNLMEKFNIDAKVFLTNHDIYGYSYLKTDFINEVVNSEMIDHIIEYAEENRSIYFKLGVDVAYMLMGKEPIFYDLSEIKELRIMGGDKNEIL